MEEQCHITRQLQYTNQTHRTVGGLSQDTTVTLTGTKVQHTNQNNIEIACLEEAQARFTQANDMPCMIEPLYSDLHWLGTHLPSFNQITASMYLPPDRTSTSAQLLLPLMQWPPEITDKPTNLSLLARQTGWLKAKEATASSKSGAHFGHYKTGALHDDINEMHTLLVDIPLQSRFSYQQWKKGINIMLKNQRKL